MTLKSIIQNLKTFMFRNNLNRLAEIYGTDKWGVHWYTQHYAHHFHMLRKKNLKILEIGVGGYDNPRKGGASLRMWKSYFRKSHIFSLDIFDKSAIQEDRITILQGSQVDIEFLEKLNSMHGPFDIIIDDGSHVNEHVIFTFEKLFPELKNDGIYVVEDTQTSYWPEFGGDSFDLNNTQTMMNYFKHLTDCLNSEEFICPGYVRTYFDKWIKSVTFYHNMIFIQKGKNNEGSNKLINNERKEDREFLVAS